jgi:flavodoxin
VKSKGGGKVRVKLQRAEAAKPQDLLRGDLLVLASGTWNTGGSEGQLHPYMHELLKERAKGVDLKGKSCALIALGDSRYFYTARAMEHLMAFARQSSGQVVDSLVIVNEPYGQEEKIRTWGEKILAKIPTKKP